MDLLIPKGTRLYHGTIEEFPELELTVGGYDRILWTAESSAIAQTYIPCAGTGFVVDASSLVRPTQDERLQEVQRRIGIDYFYGTPRGPEFDAMGRPKAYFPPAGVELELFRDMWNFQKEVARRIAAAGWKPLHGHSGVFEFQVHNGRLLPPGECAVGRLFVITVEQDLRVFDLTHGGEVEGDLMDVDYHKIDTFDAAERAGYDGVKINDFAQSKVWGNFGHESIGIFARSIPKLSWVAIPASHFESEEMSDYNKPTPELAAWETGTKRSNPGTNHAPTRFVVRICREADSTHRESLRAYAHTFHRPSPMICVSSAFFGLPVGHACGVLAHEIGHLLAGPKAGEEAADRAFEEATGVRIQYRDGQHGRCLQWLPANDRRRLAGVFEFDFGGVRRDLDEPDGDDVRFLADAPGGRIELATLRDAEAHAEEHPDVDVWAQEGRRRLAWRPLARNPQDAREVRPLTVICAWCGKHMSGPELRPGERPSHGMCAECKARELAEAGLAVENPRRNVDAAIRELERRAAAGDEAARLQLAHERWRVAPSVEDGEALLRFGDLSVLPVLVELWRAAGRMDPAWDSRGAVEIWRGVVTGRSDALQQGLAGREVEAVSIMTPRPNKAGWADPRVATLIRVTGRHGPGWAEVWGEGPLASHPTVDGIPDWVGRLMHARRLIPETPRRRGSATRRPRRPRRPSS